MANTWLTKERIDNLRNAKQKDEVFELLYKNAWSEEPNVLHSRNVHWKYGARSTLDVMVGGRYLPYSVNIVESIGLVKASEAIKHYRVGDRVLIPKYGNRYAASVEKVGRTRLHVEFTTVGGKEKHTTIPAVDAELIHRVPREKATA